MKMVRLDSIFEVCYGSNLGLNAILKSDDGINFVSRTAKNNGISAKVKLLDTIKPIPKNTITVALGGSVLSTFLQPEPFYCGYHIYCLFPKLKMSDTQKLFYVKCISANRYKYSYGRQANKTLRSILIPDLSDLPAWVNKTDINQFDDANQAFRKNTNVNFDVKNWKSFEYQELFEIKKGKRLTKADMTTGGVPFIGSIDSNNGYREYIGQEPTHEGNTITVNYNGSVAEAFYQSRSFWASDDVNVLYPKFNLNQFIALFIVTLIKLEKYRFNYGRKWTLEKMKQSIIKLPTKADGTPDCDYMENYIKSLSYSSQI